MIGPSSGTRVGGGKDIGKITAEREKAELQLCQSLGNI